MGFGSTVRMGSDHDLVLESGGGERDLSAYHRDREELIAILVSKLVDWKSRYDTIDLYVAWISSDQILEYFSGKPDG